MRARNPGGPRATVLDALIAQRDCKHAGRPCAEWVAENRDKVEAGITYDEGLGDPDSRRHAESFRQTLRRPLP